MSGGFFHWVCALWILSLLYTEKEWVRRLRLVSLWVEGHHESWEGFSTYLRFLLLGCLHQDLIKTQGYTTCLVWENEGGLEILAGWYKDPCSSDPESWEGEDRLHCCWHLLLPAVVKSRWVGSKVRLWLYSEYHGLSQYLQCFRSFAILACYCEYVRGISAVRAHSMRCFSVLPCSQV